MDVTNGKYIKLSKLEADGKWTLEKTAAMPHIWMRCLPILKCIQELLENNQHKRYGKGIQELKDLITKHIKQFNKNASKSTLTEETKEQYIAVAEAWREKYGKHYEDNTVPSNWPSGYQALSDERYHTNPVDSEVRSANVNHVIVGSSGALDEAPRRETIDTVSALISNIKQ